MSETIRCRGQTYTVGNDAAFEPLPLPDWWTTILPAGWEEVAAPGPPDRDYHRAYHKHGTTRVLVSCARYPDHKRWVHVSVSRKNREIPNWACMAEVKDVFIGVGRTALQVMPPRQQHINIHPGCLHWWHCLDGNVTPDFTMGGDTI